jgi:phage terminase small subunit
MKLPANLHIVRGRPKKKSNQNSLAQPAHDATSNWLDRPEMWDRSVFIANATSYLLQKNGGIDTADGHLLSMLASQIEIYVESILNLRAEGLVTTFNGGVTVGPNPHMAIADRALYRSVQVMKELELSPKSRDGYQSTRQLSPEISSLLEGP